MKFYLIVPPVQGGVSDFAKVLSSKLLTKHDVRILVWEQRMTESQLDEVTDADCVYLQYSGYGFSMRGAPLWLLLALRKRRHRIKHFCVFFHELYAFGPIWSSAFWLSPLQRYIAARLARLSDAWLTNRQASATWLNTHSDLRPYTVLPVFSNVGEASACPVAKKRCVVIFGGASLRAATYHAAGPALFRWAAANSMSVHDVGPSLQDAKLAELLVAQGVTSYGIQSPGVISALLATSQYGVLAYHPEYLAKSGVLAAYCAHGVVPVLVNDGSCELEGLIAGVNYLQGLPSGLIDDTSRAELAQAAWSWYQPHRIRAHADAFLTQLDLLECPQ